MSEKYGHWEYPVDFEPEEWFGFIYRIIDTENNKEYIGKKQFWSLLSKPVKGKTRRKKIKKESNWKKYTSSSTHLNEAIQTKGKENFIFIIEALFETKAALHYAEIEYQIFEDVLRSRLPNGERKYYNGMIGNVKFIPPIDSEKEKKMKLKNKLLFEDLTDEQKDEWSKLISE